MCVCVCVCLCVCVCVYVHARVRARARLRPVPPNSMASSCAFITLIEACLIDSAAYCMLRLLLPRRARGPDHCCGLHSSAGPAVPGKRMMFLITLARAKRSGGWPFDR